MGRAATGRQKTKVISVIRFFFHNSIAFYFVGVKKVISCGTQFANSKVKN